MSAPPKKQRLVVAAALFVASLALLVSTARGLGYARDEGFYFHAGRTYGAWLELLAEDRGEAMRRQVVDAHFSVNNEHPALIKLAFAASHVWLDERWDLFEEAGTAFRFPAMALAAALCAALYLRASRSGHAAGLVAALSLLFMPHVFYHAHLACFDVPIMAMFFFVCLAYERALETEGPLWPALTGVLFGLALDTKHNSWFLPIAFGTHAVALAVIAWRERRGVFSATRRSLEALGAMALLGPPVLVALWPWLWHEPYERFLGYARFHLEHDYYNMEFLGSNYFQPPFPRTYAPLMTLATVPVVTLAAGTWGAASSLWSLARDLKSRAAGAVSRHRSLVLWVLAIGASYGAWLSSSTPIFGGTKHWMTAYPFFALFAARGFELARRRVGVTARARTAFGAAAVSAIVALLLVVSPAYQALHAHPWGLGAYGPVVGGAPGAASLGLNRSFWGYTTGSVVDYLNQAVPKNGKVYVHDTAWPSWDMLQEDGRLRKDIRGAKSAGEADFALYHHEMHMQGEEYQAWVAFGTVAPDVVRGLDGVPVVMVYRRRR